jgi:phosphohistidine phosphatase
MKTLVLLRHGKAESYNEDGDKHRVLTDRGVRDAERMGNLIGQLFGGVDTVVSSDADRAVQTAKIAARAAGYIGTIQYLPEIYGASAHTLAHIVRQLSGDLHTTLLIGHNPGFEEFCSDLTGESIADCRLPTCGMARVDLPDHWKNAANSSGKLAGLWSPKSL